MAPLTSYEVLGLGYGLSDLEGRLISFDPVCAQILGRSHDDMIGLTANETTHPDDRRSYVEVLDWVASTGTPIVARKRSLRPDGSIIWVENRVTLFHGPSPQLLITTRAARQPSTCVRDGSPDWAEPTTFARYLADLAAQLARMSEIGHLDLTADLFAAASALARLEVEMIAPNGSGPN